MRSILVGALALAAVASLGHAQAQDAAANAKPAPMSEARKFTADRVFDLRYAADPQISPDGRSIIYVRRAMDRFKDRVTGSLWRIDAATGAQRPVLPDAAGGATPRWSPDGRRLVYLAAAGERAELRVVFLDTGLSFSLAQLEEPPSAPVWSPDGKSIAFAMHVNEDPPSFAKPPRQPEDAKWAKPMKVIDDVTFRADGEGYLKKGRTQVFVVSADGGAPRRVVDAPHDFFAPEWLDSNTLLVVGNDAPDADLQPVESEIYAIDLKTLARRKLTNRVGPDFSPRTAPDGRSIAYLGYDDQHKAYRETDLYVMRPDGTGVRNLTASFGRSIDDMVWRPDGRAIIAQVETDGLVSLVSIPVDGGAPKVLTDKVGGTDVTRPYAAGSFSVAREGGATPAIAFTRGSADRPAEVGFLRERERPEPLTRLNEDSLGHLDLARIEKIQAKSSVDGRSIDAWVAFPPGFQPNGSAPMILEIHGGPWSMYGPFFAAEIQRYAAEGYLVVYANPRGSTGYGEAFAQAIERNYPGPDHVDLMSVVDDVVKRGWVDRKRLFVTGGSGGGVLTAWTVGKTDRFAAAAVIKPVINWTTMATTSDIGPFVMKNWLGVAPWEDPQLYWRLSPLSVVGSVKTPTLVMVGEEDYRTPTWEAEQLYGALKMRGVETALVRVPGAPHDISARPSQLAAKVDTIMGWFAKHDPAKASAR